MNTEINIRPIENGYMVSVYRPSSDLNSVGFNEQWYCIDIQEINQRVEKILFS